jgi:hypothetical protein
MKLFTNFLLYLLIGFALYFLGLLFKKKFPAAFKFFFIAGPGSALIVYLITLILPGHGKGPAWVTSVLVLMRWIDRASLVVLGYGLGYLAGSGSRYVVFLIRGLSIQLGIVFIGSAIEQYNDIVDIEKFFLSAGYAVWFMYLILAIQLICGVLLLLNLKFYTKLSTKVVLLVVMAGAVVTHYRRGDPFNVAIPAIQLAVKCLLLIWIYVKWALPKKSI